MLRNCLALAAFVVAGFCVASTGMAQWQGGYQYSNPAGESLNWLLTPQIQKELEIVPEQIAKLSKIREENQKEVQEAYKSYNEFPPEERQARYLETMKELGAETEKKVVDVLLPQQIRRLKQIMLQMKLAQAGYGYNAAAAFGGEDLIKELEITPEQIEELKKKEEEVRKEIQEKTQDFYKKLRDDAREKIMGVLTEDQRRRLDGLVGEKFEWKYEAPAGGGVRVIGK
jgi:hypothetical protein